MNIKNHIITDSNVNGVPFEARIISPKGLANVRPMEKLRSNKYIVPHNTGNPAASADDRAHAVYLQNVENADSAYVSWHISVDEDSAIQHIPLDEVAFHASDGKGDGNRAGIGIEICENGNQAKAEENAIRTICALIKAGYAPSVNEVLPHRYFAPDKKLCPHLILKSESQWQANWKVFQGRIKAEYDRLYNSNIE